MRNLLAPLYMAAPSLATFTIISAISPILPAYASNGIVDDSIWTRLNAAKKDLVIEHSTSNNNAFSIYKTTGNIAALGIFLGTFGVLATLMLLERRNKRVTEYGSL